MRPAYRTAAPIPKLAGAIPPKRERVSLAMQVRPERQHSSLTGESRRAPPQIYANVAEAIAWIASYSGGGWPSTFSSRCRATDYMFSRRKVGLYLRWRRQIRCLAGAISGTLASHCTGRPNEKEVELQP